MLVTAASQAARLQSQMIYVDAWTVADWSMNPELIRSSPWWVLVGKVRSPFSTAPEMYKGLTLSQLFSDGLPMAWPGDTLVTYALVSGDRLGSRVVTAKLNMWASGGVLNSCLAGADLRRMAEGTFVPSTGGSAWTPLEVIDYLQSNHIAPG